MNQLYPLPLGNMAQVVRCVHTQGRVPSLTIIAGKNNSVKNYLIEFASLLIRFLKARVRKKGELVLLKLILASNCVLHVREYETGRNSNEKST